MTIANAGRRLPDADLLSPAEVARLLGVSGRTLRAMIASGRFPAPISLTHKTKRWPRAIVGQALGLVGQGVGNE